MGNMIEYKINGSTTPGYLAEPLSGEGPGVVVIQEWWGLVDHIKDVCDRLAAQGFFALAPDLYKGRVSSEPDEAAKEMMALKMDEASKDMSGAVEELIRRTGKDGVGVIGFCMGGGLAYVLASKNPHVKALVPFYGVTPWPDATPDYSKIEAAIQGHYAEKDDFASPEIVRDLESNLKGLGKTVEFYIYPGTQHAFFNDARPEIYDATASRQAWDRTIEFLKDHLG
jgi:carboxymethylenebutenolidase